MPTPVTASGGEQLLVERREGAEQPTYKSTKRGGESVQYLLEVFASD